MLAPHASVAPGHACWSCRGMVTDDLAFCPTCRVIQPPHPQQDWFCVLDLPVGFPLDRVRLEERYQAFQKQFHPDRFAMRSARERRFSLEHVIRLNEAYHGVKDPLARSEYLLTLWRQQGSGSDETSATDPEFLMEMMERQETLEELDLASKEATHRLDVLRTQTEGHIQHVQEELTRLFEGVAASPDASLLAQITQANHRFRYHRRFLESLDQAEETRYEGSVL